VSRAEAATFLAAAGPGLGIGDPVKAIEAFEELGEEAVQAARAELVLPAAYRNARRLLRRNG
jgi:hypothetical protein